MTLEMLGKLVDPLGQERDLHFRRTRISLVSLKIADDFLFFGLRQHVTKKPFQNGLDQPPATIKTFKNNPYSWSIALSETNTVLSLTAPEGPY